MKNGVSSNNKNRLETTVQIHDIPVKLYDTDALVFWHLYESKLLTQMEMLNVTLRLSAYIHRLRSHGFDITTTRIKVLTKSTGKKSRVGCYSLNKNNIILMGASIL